MQKLSRKIRRVVLLQNIVLAMIALLVSALVVIYFTPDKNGVSWVFMPSLYFIVFAVPFALVVMIYSILVFTSVRKSNQNLKVKISVASWASVFVGFWTLGYFAFFKEINLWAFLISHDVVVAVQSSPVVLGFALLALHVYVARFARRQLNADTADRSE